MLSHNLFVRGSDMLAPPDGAHYVVKRRPLAAHNLYHNVHIGIVYNARGIGGKDAVGQGCVARLGNIAHDRSLYRERRADEPRQLIALIRDNARHAATNHAHAQQPYAYRSFHQISFLCALLFDRCRVCRRLALIGVCRRLLISGGVGDCAC